MVAFWILATLMTLLALAVVLVPLLRARAGAGPSARDVALEVLRGQRSEIESDIAAGQLPADARAKKKTKYRADSATLSLDGRNTGRARTCGFDTFLYDGYGVPVGPYCH